MIRVLLPVVLVFQISSIFANTCERIQGNHYRCSVERERLPEIEPVRVTGAPDLQRSFHAIAAIEMILGYQHLKLSQEEIFTRLLHQTTEDRFIRPEEFSRLNQWKPEFIVGSPEIVFRSGYKDLEKYLFSLSHKIPLLLGLNSSSHPKVCLLLEIQFQISFDKNGNRTGIIPEKVFLYDFESDKEKEIEMRWNEFRERVALGYFLSVKGL
ncbi:MAG: hypothetical protein H7A24_06040 [Leptospiraceae bacterium]|nr:hypothetical protein [Leptospiraceae bacterium]MCP5511420.1 hypothetical protein [Leptospiraceae bacterium]